MKIISIGPACPLRGGIAKFNESFAMACKSAGYDVEVFSFRFLYPGFLFPGKSQYSDDPPPKEIKINSVLHSLNPFNWVINSIRIIRLRPDIVVIHYWMPFFAPVLGFIARRISRKTNARIIAIAHNLIPHEKQLFSGALSRFFINSIGGVVCLSSSVLEDVRELTKTKPVVNLPHPLYDIYGTKVSKESALRCLKLQPEKKYLLFFGLIRKYKGLELLLKSFAEINQPDLMLIVAGEFYEDKVFYYTLAEKLGISARVIFTDSFIPDEDVKYYFSAADMVVQPYITATQSGVTQIAYQFDCPMLVTNTGGLAEIVINNKTGFVCEKNHQEIADKISFFFKNNMADAMIENIKKEKQRFSWDVFVKQFIVMAESLN